MSPKNLNVIKIPKILKEKLSNKKVLKLYNNFEKSFNIQEDFIVAVSGGPDSLALAFLAEVYSIKKGINCKYFLVDHKLRKDSSIEANQVKKILKKLKIHVDILTWHGKKPKNNIQSIARKKRYDLLLLKCKKFNIQNLVVGHHLDDLFENFFIRMLRGSGLKGLVSLEKKKILDKINLIRPLLNFSKNDLEFISKHVFSLFIKDPSNEDIKYTRTRVRKIISEFKSNGFSKDKLFLTLKNLKKSNNALSFYVEKNKKQNTFFNKDKRELILNNDFFYQPYEVLFRSMSDSIKLIGNKHNAARGKKIDNILKKIRQNSIKKETLGGCIIKKVNQTVIISKEH